MEHNEKSVKRIMQNLLQILAYIHSKGIMHRDVKPENLMLRKKNNLEEICLIDFGLSTFIDLDDYLYRRCGTPGYVGPEVVTLKPGEKYNEKCDIFSAGVIFYIL